MAAIAQTTTTVIQDARARVTVSIFTQGMDGTPRCD
jgi:hypothetical protein